MRSGQQRRSRLPQDPAHHGALVDRGLAPRIGSGHAAPALAGQGQRHDDVGVLPGGQRPDDLEHRPAGDGRQQDRGVRLLAGQDVQATDVEPCRAEGRAGRLACDRHSTRALGPRGPLEPRRDEGRVVGPVEQPAAVGEHGHQPAGVDRRGWCPGRLEHERHLQGQRRRGRGPRDPQEVDDSVRAVLVGPEVGPGDPDDRRRVGRRREPPALGQPGAHGLEDVRGVETLGGLRCWALVCHGGEPAVLVVVDRPPGGGRRSRLHRAEGLLGTGDGEPVEVA